MGRAELKRSAILSAAGTVFLRNGYVGASMDEIAATAAVSKQTVYKHFANKEDLFAELIRDRVRGVSEAVYGEAVLSRRGNTGDDLRDLGIRLLTRVMQPDLLQLRRLVIAEAARFPELGRLFYELGPGRLIEQLSEALAGLVESGELEIDDPDRAAGQLNWLITSGPLNRAMLRGEDQPLDADEVGQVADDAVRLFLAAYRKA